MAENVGNGGGLPLVETWMVSLTQSVTGPHLAPWGGAARAPSDTADRPRPEVPAPRDRRRGRPHVFLPAADSDGERRATVEASRGEHAERRQSRTHRKVCRAGLGRLPLQKRDQDGDLT